MFKCDICNTPYENRKDYVECVNACDLKARQKAAQEKKIADQKKLEKEQAELRVEYATLEELQKQSNEAIEAFVKKHPNENVTIRLPGGYTILVRGGFGPYDVISRAFDPLFNW